MKHSRIAGLLVLVAVALSAAPAASQEIGGKEAGALPLPPGASAANMSLVAWLPLPGGVHGDISAHRGFAYLGNAGEPECPTSGIRVVDVVPPHDPQLVGMLAQHPGSSQQDMAVIAADTPAFRGDLLAVGLQPCGPNGLRGAEFWDVSDPRQPERLGFVSTPEANGVHELALVQRPADGRVLALLAVPFSESSESRQGDLRIVDVSDPRNPVQLSDWGIGAQLGIDPLVGQGQFPSVYGHSVLPNADGTRAVISYWDAGFVILDIADPSNPVFLGKTSYAPDEEGNGHSVAFAHDGRILVGADEDFNPSVKGSLVNSPPSLARGIESVEATFTPRLALTGERRANVVNVGPACPPGDPPQGVPGGNPLLADPAGAIALIDGSTCYYALPLQRVEQGGAIGALVINLNEGPPIPMGTLPELPQIGIPAVMIRRDDGERLKAAIAAGATVNVTLGDTIAASYNDWGYLRLFDLSDPANPVQVGRFGTPNTFTDRVSGPPDDGEYMVHNPIVDGDTVYASWYSEGVRAIDISDPANPREVGYFVPPDYPSLSPNRPSDRARVWGVAKMGDLILLSDMDSGLWILRHTRG